MMLPIKCFNGEIIKSETIFSVPDGSLVNFMRGTHIFSPLNDTETSSQIKKIQARTPTTPNIAADVVDDDVIILDDDDDVEPATESTENPKLSEESLVEKDYDISAMQAQLDEEIMRDLEAEEDICKALQTSKGYRLMMETESLEEKPEETNLMKEQCKKKDIKEQESLVKTSEENKLKNEESKIKYISETESLQKKSKENKLFNTDFKMNDITEKESSIQISEESIKKLIEAQEDEEICIDDLIIVDYGVDDITTISDSGNEGTSETMCYPHAINCEKEELVCVDKVETCSENDIKEEIYSKTNDVTDYSNDSDQDLDWDLSTNIKEEEMKSVVLSEEKVRLEPSDLIEAYVADMIVDDQSIKTEIEVNMEPDHHECKECGFRGEWRQYIVHVSTECFATQFTCNLCITFSSIRDFLKHLTEHDYEPLSCPECHIQKRSFDELQTHVVSHILTLFTDARTSSSQETSLYYCKKCGNCVQFQCFFKHWQMHVNGLCYTEEDYSSESSADVEEDVMSSELIAEALAILQTNAKRGRVKQCIVCYKIIERGNELKRHLIEHLLTHAIYLRQKRKCKMFKCYFCQKKFAKVNDWKYHMRDHSYLYVYECPLCNKRFSDSSNFCKHKKVHNLFSYICDLCGGKYQKKQCLIQHLKLHENSLSCEVCDRPFVSESRLKKHMAHRHNTNGVQGRPFSCPMCSKRFKSWRDKQEHLWKRHGYRKVPADCPICDIGFRTLAMVKRHMKLKHKATYKIKFTNEEEKKEK